MLVFPTHRFCFEGHEADIERRTVSGGTPLSGDEDLIPTDGGGRLFCEFTNPYLDDPRIALEWRGLSAESDGGATPMIVFLGDVRHQMVGDAFAPDHGADSETAYPATPNNVTVLTDAELRATTLSLSVTFLPEPVRKGMWLSIDHTNHRWRSYRIAKVVSDIGGDVIVEVRPPIREQVTAGTLVEWANPRCVMRAEGEMRSPSVMGFAEAATIRFVEHFPGEAGYA